MSLSTAQRLKLLLSQMTLDEKLAQMGSCWAFELQTNGQLDPDKVSARFHYGIGQVTRLAGASTFDPCEAARSANTLQRYLVEETRLGIPAIFHEECCSGAMVLGGSTFPQMLGLAATFQPELAEAMTSAIRKQLMAIGARQGLSPVLDLARDPRWGRVEETFGEDPTLASHFGMAYVRGLQGENLREGVLATGKHFIGHSLSLGGLNCAPSHIGTNDLYNVMLMPFQAAIQQAGLATIMNAYPELDGEVVAASRRILTGLLREQLGFDGLVVSDYEAIVMIHNYHQMAADKTGAAALALQAGIDVELPSVKCYDEALRAALEAGDVNLEMVDLAVERHLRKKDELGLFERPYVDEQRVLESFETGENRALAREIAQQSMVLLKNDGTLPLNKQLRTLAVIGPNAYSERNLLGDYSYHAGIEYVITIAPESSALIGQDSERIPGQVRITSVLEGIQAAVSPSTRVLYAKGCDLWGDDTSGFEEALRIAGQADAVVLVLGDRAGLTPQCTTGETRDSADLHLSGAQEALAKAVMAAGKPVVAVLINGKPLALPWLDEQANAILEAWLPGEEGGSAVAAVLFGEANPGGRLPISFPRSVGQLPVFYNHKPTGMYSNWYTDYVTEKVTPLYPFGYGLSYTSFEYADFNINKQYTSAGETVDISVRVANTGDRAGDEVVQLYTRDEYASVTRPVKELRGYRRLTLQPGESRNVVFHLNVDQLAFYDLDLNLVLEPGIFQLMVGSSSGDIRVSGKLEIAGKGKLPVKERVVVCPADVQ